jgi:hypothetical protein
MRCARICRRVLLLAAEENNVSALIEDFASMTDQSESHLNQPKRIFCQEGSGFPRIFSAQQASEYALNVEL